MRVVSHVNAAVVWGSHDPHTLNLLQQITQFLQGTMFRLADNTVNVIILVVEVLYNKHKGKIFM